MSASSHAHDHGDHEHKHHSVWFYVGVIVFLGIITAYEIGPLFEIYNIPGPVLLALSFVKFIVVVLFFMHLADDAPVFSSIFFIPLAGAGAMVAVLMTLFQGYTPSPATDALPVQERYWSTYSGECSSWLRSNVTNRWYCASPAIDNDKLLAYVAPPAPKKEGLDWSIDGLDAAAAKALLIEKGEALYGQQCVACHQPTGAGVPGAFPPLAGSDFIGEAAVHAQVIVHGLNGRIVVNGVEYNGAMTPYKQLDDLEIAAIATYERNAWGNAYDEPVVTPEIVRAARAAGPYKP